MSFRIAFYACETDLGSSTKIYDLDPEDSQLLPSGPINVRDPSVIIDTLIVRIGDR